MDLVDTKVEDNLIYRLLIEPNDMALAEDLSPSAFATQRNATVFAEMKLRYEQGVPIDVPLIEAATGIDIDILQISQGATAPIEEYIRVVSDLAVRRDMASILESARGKILAGADPASVATKAIERLALSHDSAGMVSSPTAVREYRNEYVRRSTQGRGIPFGIPGLDTLLLPMRRGNLVVFAARPGIGKTAVAESIADAVGRDHGVLFVSLEMLAGDLIDRGLARTSGRAAQSIIAGEVDITELEPHLVARDDLQITYMDRGGATVSDIQRGINSVRLSRESDLGLVVVDYLQLVAGEPKDNETMRVSNISHELKRLAMQNEVAVLALAQLNRNLEYAEGNRAPRLSDLKASGSIEQDADAVVVINGKAGDPMREFHVLKQRQGSLGRIDVLFDGSTQRWGASGLTDHDFF